MFESESDGLEGVILAAGGGTRMQPFSNHYPKPLLPILNVPLIQYQIRFLTDLGARRIIIVIGHLGHEIAQALGRETADGIPLEYVEQTDSLGIAHAVAQVEESVSGPFVLLLGDIFFEPAADVDPIAIIRKHGADGFLSVQNEPDPAAIRRNFAVYMNDDGVVHRVIEKQRFPKTTWKGSGLAILDQSFFDALRRTPRTAGRNEYELIDAIQIYIDDGAKVIGGEAFGWDLNLTFPYDLLAANILALSHQGQAALVSPDSNVHPECQLHQCVIGPNVEITEPITIERSLVFDGATVPVHEPLDRVVVTPDKVVDCRYWIGSNGELLPGALGM